MQDYFLHASKDTSVSSDHFSLKGFQSLSHSDGLTTIIFSSNTAAICESNIIVILNVTVDECSSIHFVIIQMIECSTRSFRTSVHSEE